VKTTLRSQRCGFVSNFHLNMDMNQPIFSAPPGYVVDVENPQRTGEAANFWVGTLGMIFAAIFMVIRVFTKTRLAKGFTPDDSKLAQISQNTSQAFCNGIQYLTKTNSSVARSLGTWQYISHRAGCSLDLADDQVYSASPLPSKFLFCVCSEVFINALKPDLTLQKSSMAEALSAYTSGN
jgi:hypothetical protein